MAAWKEIVVVKWDNGVASVRIPVLMAREMELGRGDAVMMTSEGPGTVKVESLKKGIAREQRIKKSKAMRRGGR